MTGCVIMPRDDQQDVSRTQGHVEAFRELPRATREWLETRRKEDWEKIDDALEFYRKAKDRGRFLIWILGSLLTLFLGFGTFADQIVRLLNWLRGHP